MAMTDQAVAMTSLGGQAPRNHLLEMMVISVWVDCSASVQCAV